MIWWLYFLFIFFFFFKQKTAYEMRISDWSSDVCSSDLPSGGDGGPRLRARRGRGGVGDGGAQRAASTAHGEIGRASCRERVCQVRVDLGGRRIIKKKNKRRMMNTRMRKTNKRDNSKR